MPWRRMGPMLLIFIAALSSRGSLAVRVECGGDFYLEPIEEWRARGVVLKSSGKPPRAGPEVAEVPPAQAPAVPPAGPPEAAKEAPAPPPRTRETAEPCDRAIDEFWQGTEVAVGGVSYRLARVYTIDLDSDNRVDDVGFRLKTRRTLPSRPSRSRSMASPPPARVALPTRSRPPRAATQAAPSPRRTTSPAVNGCRSSSPCSRWTQDKRTSSSPMKVPALV